MVIMITKIYLEWFPCEKYITGMPLGLFSQKMKLRAPFPISEGERPGEETRRESSYDETGRTISEQTERTPRGLVTFDTKQVS